MTRPGRALRVWFVALGLAASVGVVLLGLFGPPQAVSAPGVRTFEPIAPACRISDERLTGISGMAVRSDGTWVVNDRGETLYRLGPSCQVVESVDLGPKLKKLDVTLQDVEDLAAGPDGWLWLADTGGNVAPRHTVTLVGWRAAGTPVQVAELRYPSGEPDVEALIVDSVGRAILITKVAEDEGSAVVYRTELPLGAAEKQTLKRVGTMKLEKPEGTGSGSRLVTAADVDPTGTYVVVRTYTNAWEFDAPDGDLAAALISGEPRLVPLPVSEQGEAIAYTLDGGQLLATGEGDPVELDRVQITRSPQ